MSPNSQVAAPLCGGHVDVTTISAPLSNAHIVHVDVAGASLDLQPDSARKLAVALLAAAQEAERTAPTVWP
jgi:hypothetical protein